MVTNSEFVVTWCRSGSRKEVAQTLNVSVQTVYYHAKRLKEAGVKLPKFKSVRGALTQLEIAQLNSLVKKHTNDL